MNRLRFLGALCCLLWPLWLQAQGRINAAEYFIDRDPGPGKGTPMPLQAASAQPTLQHTLRLQGLSPGAHFLGIRLRGEDGRWSLTDSRLLFVSDKQQSLPLPGRELLALEYFIEEDPGVGKGQRLPYTPAMTLPLSGLPTGRCLLGVRLLDSGGQWSQTYTFYLLRPLDGIPLAPQRKYVQAEVFFKGGDPGVGKAFPLSLPEPSTRISLPLLLGPDQLQALGLGPGRHYAHFRLQDEQGAWSLTSAYMLDVCRPEAPAAAFQLLSSRGDTLLPQGGQVQLTNRHIGLRNQVADSLDYDYAYSLRTREGTLLRADSISTLNYRDSLGYTMPQGGRYHIAQKVYNQCYPLDSAPGQSDSMLLVVDAPMALADMPILSFREDDPEVLVTQDVRTFFAHPLGKELEILVRNARTPSAKDPQVNFVEVYDPAKGALVRQDKLRGLELRLDGDKLYARPRENAWGQAFSALKAYERGNPAADSLLRLLQANITPVNDAPTRSNTPLKGSYFAEYFQDSIGITQSMASHFSDVDGDSLIYQIWSTHPGLEPVVYTWDQRIPATNYTPERIRKHVGLSVRFAADFGGEGEIFVRATDTLRWGKQALSYAERITIRKGLSPPRLHKALPSPFRMMDGTDTLLVADLREHFSSPRGSALTFKAQVVGISSGKDVPTVRIDQQARLWLQVPYNYGRMEQVAVWATDAEGNVSDKAYIDLEIFNGDAPPKLRFPSWYLCGNSALRYRLRTYVDDDKPITPIQLQQPIVLEVLPAKEREKVQMTYDPFNSEFGLQYSGKELVSVKVRFPMTDSDGLPMEVVGTFKSRSVQLQKRTDGSLLATPNDPLAEGSFQWLLDGKPLAGAVGNLLPNPQPLGYYQARFTATADGCATLSEGLYGVGVTGLDEQALSESVKVVPNPASGSYCQLQLGPLWQGRINVQLLDAFGREILHLQTQTDGQTIQLPTGSLPSGIYFIRLSFAQGSTVKKLIRP